MTDDISIKAVSRREYPWTCSECGTPTSPNPSMFLVNGRAMCFGHALYDVVALMSAGALSAELAPR